MPLLTTAGPRQSSGSGPAGSQDVHLARVTVTMMAVVPIMADLTMMAVVPMVTKRDDCDQRDKHAYYARYAHYPRYVRYAHYAYARYAHPFCPFCLIIRVTVPAQGAGALRGFESVTLRGLRKRIEWGARGHCRAQSSVVYRA